MMETLVEFFQFGLYLIGLETGKSVHSSLESCTTTYTVTFQGKPYTLYKTRVDYSSER